VSRFTTSKAAVTATFAIHGVLFASWTAHIPATQSRLGLADGTLGVALLGMPIGSVSAVLVGGQILPRVGSRRMIQACLAGYCLSGVLVGLAGSLATLFAGLLVWGAFQGMLDVSMNTQAIAVERAAARPLMSGWHGCWSLGALAGAGIGALGVALGLSLVPQLLILGIPALLIGEAVATRMLPDIVPSRSHQPGVRPARRGPTFLSGAVLILGAIALADMLCEGATADWASVYLRGPLHSGATTAGLGYTVYALAMAIARLSGNRLLARFSLRRLLPALVTVSTVGFAAGLVVGDTVAALIGYATLGLGVASVIPAVFGAAGRLPGPHGGTSLSTVAALGWAGFVCGPPLIGQLASAFSLPIALGLIPVLTAFIAIATATTTTLEVGARGVAANGPPLPNGITTAAQTRP
jgi:MFS family permease